MLYLLVARQTKPVKRGPGHDSFKHCDDEVAVGSGAMPPSFVMSAFNMWDGTVRLFACSLNHMLDLALQILQSQWRRW